MHDAQAGMLDPGASVFLANRDPYFKRRLSGQLMVPECGQQADHAIGNALRRPGERAVFCGIGRVEYVQTPSDTLQAPVFAETAQVRSGDARWL